MLGARSVLRFGTVLAVCVAGLVLAGGAWAVTPGSLCVPATAGQRSGAARVGTTAGAALRLRGQRCCAPTYRFSASGIGGKPTIKFSGVNVQIVDGSGHTSTVNGTGNLVLGYDESPGTQTGSHDLILGEKQSYTGYGELLGGYGNNVSGATRPRSGYRNTASGSYSLIAGDQNTVSGTASSVLGGYKNVVSSAFSTLSGGCSNLVGTGTVSVSSLCSNTTSYNHDFASITGGSGNQATGISSSLSGGQFNLASDPFSSVTGGCDNLAGTGSLPVGELQRQRARSGRRRLSRCRERVFISFAAGGNSNHANFVWRASPAATATPPADKRRASPAAPATPPAAAIARSSAAAGSRCHSPTTARRARPCSAPDTSDSASRSAQPESAVGIEAGSAGATADAG